MLKTLLLFFILFFHTDLVNDFSDYAWIGLYDSEGTNTWSWTDGSLLDFTAWFYKQPNNLNHKCVSVSKISYYFILIISCNHIFIISCMTFFNQNCF